MRSGSYFFFDISLVNYQKNTCYFNQVLNTGRDAQESREPRTGLGCLELVCLKLRESE